jgi:DNA-binding NtrC family response regulator
MIMTEQAQFLLINGSHDHYWHEVLAQTLMPLGTLHISTGAAAINLVQLAHYDLIIIDAAAVENVPVLVAHIRSQKPEARIIVATASPTWTRAREAFQAGAIDYIRKSLDQDELQSALRGALDKTLPPWR